MRVDNVLLEVICTAAVVAAATIAWRGRSLPVIAPRDTPTTPSSAAFDALRTLACVLTAGFVAGLRVVGFGGRLLMRVLAATSGGGAQRRTTDAGERVGEITLGGSIGFFIFAGLLVPLASSLVFIPLRRVLPLWLVLLFNSRPLRRHTSSVEPSCTAGLRRPSTAPRCASLDTQSWRSAQSLLRAPSTLRSPTSCDRHGRAPPTPPPAVA